MRGFRCCDGAVLVHGFAGHCCPAVDTVFVHGHQGCVGPGGCSGREVQGFERADCQLSVWFFHCMVTPFLMVHMVTSIDDATFLSGHPLGAGDGRLVFLRILPWVQNTLLVLVQHSGLSGCVVEFADLLRNTLGTAAFDRLRKVFGPSSSPTIGTHQ